jgi:hypothetical protein
VTAATVGGKRLRRISIALHAYLSFVVAVGFALPVLSLLQYHGKIHFPWLIDTGRSILPWAASVVASFILCHKFVSKKCTEIAGWIVGTPGDNYPWTIVGFCLLLLTSYAWQLNIGIAHRGVPGWVYADLPDFVQSKEPSDLSLPSNVKLSVFEEALQPWVMPYVHRSGFASSEVLFLHFKDGTMRPANYQLAMVSWPKSTFKLENGNMTHGQAFLAIVKHYFANRRAGISFLLPAAIAYPNHINYQRIDYRSYPSADEIIGASLWTLTVRVDDRDGKVKVIGAQKIAQVTQ